MTSDDPSDLVAGSQNPLIDIVVRNAPIVLFATDERGVLTLSRGRALDAMGLGQGELVGQSVFDLYTDEPAVAAGVRSALAGKAVTVPLRLDGVVHETMFAPMRDGDGAVTGLIGVATDVTERVRAEEVLQHRLQFDATTGLANRTYFTDLVDTAIERARGTGSAVAVIAVRLARYRDIADSMGHATAECAADEIAARLVALQPQPGAVGRLDGGRFAVLASSASPSEATRLALAVVQALSDPCEVLGYRLDVQPRAGVALFPGHAATGDELVLRAESALGLAVRSSDHVAIYSSTRVAAQAENLRILGDLQRALTTGEVQLHFQPLVDLSTMRVTAVEALARWNHEVLGPIPPDRFVALAESSGLIRPLTTYVLEAAAKQARAWQAAGVPLRIDVNVSPHDVLDAHFVAEVEGVAGAWGLRRDALGLEMTERAMIVDPRTTRERLTALGEMGVHLAIDDFGTGQSNFTTLKQLPFHNIKVDQSFVTGLPAGGFDSAIVSSVLSLARAMGQDVTAEGVETPEVWDVLIDLGCGNAQGYHIARPMPGEQVLPWLESGPWSGPTLPSA